MLGYGNYCRKKSEIDTKFDYVLCYKDPFFYARWELSALLSRIPGLFMPMARLLLTFQNQRSKIPYLLISDDTELVIEGYPRSANSFAVVAFEMAQGTTIPHAKRERSFLIPELKQWLCSEKWQKLCL